MVNNTQKAAKVGEGGKWWVKEEGKEGEGDGKKGEGREKRERHRGGEGKDKEIIFISRLFHEITIKLLIM